MASKRGSDKLEVFMCPHKQIRGVRGKVDLSPTREPNDSDFLCVYGTSQVAVSGFMDALTNEQRAYTVGSLCGKRYSCVSERYPEGFGPFMNENEDSEVGASNCAIRFVSTGRSSQAVIVVLQPIRAGEECFVEYDADYWRWYLSCFAMNEDVKRKFQSKYQL